MPYKDADRQRGYKREWARMQRTGECGTPGGTPLPVAFRLKTAQDVLTLLEEQVQAVRNAREASTLEKGGPSDTWPGWRSGRSRPATWLHV
jgi:hypothetical protein